MTSAAAESTVVTLPPLPSGYWKQTLSSVGRPGTASTKRTSIPERSISARRRSPTSSIPTLPTGTTWKGPLSSRAPSSTVGYWATMWSLQ